MISLNDIANKNVNWPRVLDTLLPGGEKWERYENTNKGCLTICPGWKDCDEGGPDGLVCSKDWGESEASPLILDVLKHVLENFDHYDRGDCRVKEKETEVEQLIAEVKRWTTFNPVIAGSIRSARPSN